MHPYPLHPPPTVNHPLHWLLALMTGGLWLLVYIVIVIDNGRQMRRYRDGQIVLAAQRKKG